MTKDIFISYSRRDHEFVTHLASDLHAQVAGVWFDQSTIQPGQKWHDEIMEGIDECKAFILVLSPDAAESKYVLEEVKKALELGKTIFPILYRPAQWTDEFETLVNEIQTLDLRSGSYTDNFHKLVDGLVEAGAAKATAERPFLRQATNTPLSLVFNKIPGWAFAWSMGWLVFWIVAVVILFIGSARQGDLEGDYILLLILLLISSGPSGFAGGLIAGLFTMLALRPNAPSISWKHMSPTIRIWGISGPLGIIISGLITTLTMAIGLISLSDAYCESLYSAECAAILMDYSLLFFLVIFLVYLLSVVSAWFLTGLFAGWQAVRHIRRLEPGITNIQGWKVSAGWGCGAIVAVVVMGISIFIISFVSA